MNTTEKCHDRRCGLLANGREPDRSVFMAEPAEGGGYLCQRGGRLPGGRRGGHSRSAGRIVGSSGSSPKGRGNPQSPFPASLDEGKQELRKDGKDEFGKRIRGESLLHFTPDDRT